MYESSIYHSTYIEDKNEWYENSLEAGVPCFFNSTDPRFVGFAIGDFVIL